MKERSSSPSSSSSCPKRGRPPATAVTQFPCCLVDGCTADLSRCRDYHRRHKVCELHSKSPVVALNGREMRFCQQCSRFQSLGEFDEGKRSCRQRLDGHNRRRRKPKSASLPVPSRMFLSPPQGSSFWEFGSPQTFTISDPTLSSWTTASSGEVPFATISEEPKFLEFSSPTQNADLQFPYINAEGSADAAVVLDTKVALSLLSASQRTHQANPGMGMGHVALSEPQDLSSPSLLSSCGPVLMEGNSGGSGGNGRRYHSGGESSYITRDFR